MLRTAMLLNVMLLVVASTGSLADDPPGNFSGYYWWPEPDELAGNLPGGSVSVEAGGNLYEYEFQTTDGDSVAQYRNGQQIAGPWKYYDWSQYTDTNIQSCPINNWTITHAGSVGWTERWLFTGHTGGPLETQQQATDTWYAADRGELPPNDGGSKDDGIPDPYQKLITITPNKGWIYGTVSGVGGGVQGATVRLFMGTQQVTQTTSGDGRAYSFHYVAPGNYTVKATTPMGKQGQTDASVSKGNGAQANITINP